MTPTLVTLLTPPAAGAIATLAVRGPAAWDFCRELFSPRSGELPQRPEDVAPGRFWLGRVGAEIKDEAVLALKEAGPPPLIELHCHGGREVQAMLLEAFAARGATVCEWPEWERRTAPTRLRAEAAIALARALTRRTAAILLDQYNGALERALGVITDALAAGDKEAAQRLLSGLMRYAGVGRHLTTPWRVVVAGAPNVGKSSLVNALAGYQRAVVSETPGTTRDVVTTLVALDGWPVELADTAGLRDGAEALEEAGIRLARDRAGTADLCLWVTDASAPPPPPFPPLSGGGEGGVGPALHVVNKIDLPAAWEISQAEGAVRVSARTGEGIDRLCEAIAARLVPEPPPAGAPVPFTEELCGLLEKALKHVRAGEYAEARSALAYETE